MNDVQVSGIIKKRRNPAGVPASSGKQRPRGRPFVKGQSGNPSGKPKDIEHVSVMARKHAPAAIAALVAALKSPRERVPAAIALLDRGFGKPVQMVLGDPDRPIAIDFQWADAGGNAPNAHTDTRAVAHQIEGAIIDAALDDKDDTT